MTEVSARRRWLGRILVGGAAVALPLTASISYAADGPAQVTLPSEEYAAAWDVVIDTGGDADADPTDEAGAAFDLGTHSLVVLREHSEPETSPDHSVAASLAARSGTDAS